MDGDARAYRCRLGEGEAGCDVCEGIGREVGGETRTEAAIEAERASSPSEAGRGKRKLGRIEADERDLGKRARGEIGNR